MVGEILNTYSPAGVRHDFFVSALWGDPGGVAVFDATLPTNASRSLELKELAHTATAELSRANRVVLLNASTTSIVVLALRAIGPYIPHSIARRHSRVWRGHRPHSTHYSGALLRSIHFT